MIPVSVFLSISGFVPDDPFFFFFQLYVVNMFAMLKTMVLLCLTVALNGK